MNRSEMDNLRASTLYGGEVLKVRYIGKLDYPKGAIDARPRFKRKSGLPYPQPKWIACKYQVYDGDGDALIVADERYGKIDPSYEWVKQEEMY